MTIRWMRRAAWLVILVLVLEALRPTLALAGEPTAEGDDHPPLWAPQFIATPGDVSERRIVVDLSDQRLTAYQGARPARRFAVSTGDDEHPTIVGVFTLGQKYDRIDLIGRDYYYRDVPYVMSFAPPFYIHAAPWRTQFGIRDSHGCVTLSLSDAAWLYDWAPVGTPIIVQW